MCLKENFHDNMTQTVEDIMCDQCIISSELNLAVDHHNSTKLWLQNVLYNLKNQLVPALAAFLVNNLARSLAPLQRISLSLPAKAARVRFRKRSKPQLAITNISDRERIEDCADRNSAEEPEKCVSCTVLYEPAIEPCADVIFVHGLHGGLDRTWTQGTWRLNNHKLMHQTPIRRRSTGDMYVPLKEDHIPPDGTLKRTLTKIYSKIPAKVARKNENSVNRQKIEDNDEIEEAEKDNIDRFSSCWPQDWLPQDCPGLRVVAINYTTDVLWRPLWQKRKARSDLKERSQEMIEELLRLDVGKRPIVWVGHSKGGLFIKQIILNALAATEKNDHLKNLFDQTKAIMFYSVPHKGSPIADMIFPFFRRSIELLEVQKNCDFVLDLHKRFLDIFNSTNKKKPEIFSFIDTENTPVAFTSLKFIAYESADPDIGTKCEVPLNHREICKPAGRDCFLYLELVKLINRSIFNMET